MDRERIKEHILGSQPLNGNDAYAVLGIVFDWMEKNTVSSELGLYTHGSVEELQEDPREAGYYKELE